MKLPCDKCHKEEDISLLPNNQVRFECGNTRTLKRAELRALCRRYTHVMTDWKEGVLMEYHIVERGRQMVEEEMAKNPSLSTLRLQIEDDQHQLAVQEQEYIEDIRNCDIEMQKIKDDLIERWDIEEKSFECDEGVIKIRTTRSLKIDNKERLISTLQQIGKLTQCIKGWDLTYLRKLADVRLLDVDEGETNIVHYDEKRNVVISAAKKGGNSKNEE